MRLTEMVRKCGGLVCLCALAVACVDGGPMAPSETVSAVVEASTPAAMRSDLQAVVEALFLGTGPLARADSPGCDVSLQRMRGWPRGSHVRVVAYASTDAERRQVVERTLEQVRDVFAGTLTTDYGVQDEADEPATVSPGEIAVFATQTARVPLLCGISASNCQVVRYTAGAYISSRVILSAPLSDTSSAAMAHELGHAFGLCHIDPARGGLDPHASVMGHPARAEWTRLDLEAIRAVYAAGLSPGDPRQRFVGAGLVR